MKELPEINTSFGDLYRTLHEPIRTKLLLTGIELGIFNQLSEPNEFEAVSEAIDTHPGNTRRFMDGLAVCDLVTKKNGRYQNTEIAQEFLVKGSPVYLGDFLVYAYQWSVPAFENMTALVRDGPPPAPEIDAASEDVWVAGARVTANYQRAGMGQFVAKIISGLPEFPTLKRMLDLGGGPGVIGMAIVGAHPDMKGVVFDQPAVVRVAESVIREQEMEDRMTVLGGNYMQDPIGEGYDLVWASATLNFAKQDIDLVVKKIYDALNPGGVFVSLSDGLTHEGTKPRDMTLGMVSTALMGLDMGLNQGFIAESMLRCGFSSVRSQTVDVIMGPWELDIGRKVQIPEDRR
ncbi:MAG: methyltransferase domain-containing protein [Deltaproteobacteria bacterium]|nr:methyltransferase domain-containing protein [Deltaproteobacteria bacterium]